MSYEAVVSIAINIKDGPPPVQEKRTIKNVNAANANRISFKAGTPATKKVEAGDSSDGLERQTVCRLLKFSLEANAQPSANLNESEPKTAEDKPDRLVFIAIKASKYLYKRCVNEEVSGVGYRIGGCSKGGLTILGQECGKIEWMAGDRVLLNICGALDLAKTIELYVDEKLFDCSKKEADEIVVTVTYAVLGADSTDDGTEPCCEVSGDQRSSSKANSQLRNNRQTAM